jgi:hypothetical protein
MNREGRGTFDRFFTCAYTAPWPEKRGGGIGSMECRLCVRALSPCLYTPLRRSDDEQRVV